MHTPTLWEPRHGRGYALNAQAAGLQGGGHIQHSPNTPTTGLRDRGNDTSRSTGRSGRQNAATRRNMRREERVTVQGPVKKQQPDGVSHRGGPITKELTQPMPYRGAPNREVWVGYVPHADWEVWVGSSDWRCGGMRQTPCRISTAVHASAAMFVFAGWHCNDIKVGRTPDVMLWPQGQNGGAHRWKLKRRSTSSRPTLMP